MSRASMVAALTRLDRALDLIGPYVGPCSHSGCGWPDSRHRVGDAILVAVQFGDPLESIIEEYGPGPGSPRTIGPVDIMRIAFAVRDADRRLHLVNKTVELAAAHAVREAKA